MLPQILLNLEPSRHLKNPAEICACVSAWQFKQKFRLVLFFYPLKTESQYAKDLLILSETLEHLKKLGAFIKSQ